MTDNFIDLLTVSQTIRRAILYLHNAQKPEGGWLGSWGICFTYATQFALESLSLVGETYETSESSRRACQFLISKQRDDGGWGESYKVRMPQLWFSVADVGVSVVRTGCMGRTCELSDSANVLGSDGVDACSLSTFRTFISSCEIGHVASAISASLFLLVDKECM